MTKYYNIPEEQRKQCRQEARVSLGVLEKPLAEGTVAVTLCYCTGDHRPYLLATVNEEKAVAIYLQPLGEGMKVDACRFIFTPKARPGAIVVLWVDHRTRWLMKFMERVKGFEKASGVLQECLKAQVTFDNQYGTETTVSP